MSNVQEALKAAINALEYHTEQTRPIQKTIDTLALCKAAIAEIEKCEPVGGLVLTDGRKLRKDIFTLPQPREWVSVPIEPVAWKRTRKSNGETEYFTDREYKHEALFDWIPLYAAPTDTE